MDHLVCDTLVSQVLYQIFFLYNRTTFFVQKWLIGGRPPCTVDATAQTFVYQNIWNLGTSYQSTVSFFSAGDVGAMVVFLTTQAFLQLDCLPLETENWSKSKNPIQNGWLKSSDLIDERKWKV